MDPQNNIKQLQDLITNANDVLIITKETPSLDGLAASLAIYNALIGQKSLSGKQKKVIIAVSGRQGTQYSLLPGSDKIVSELGLRDLVIGVNGYVDNAIEGVNWYVEQGRLNVVFKSNPAVPMQFDLKSLDPFYAGANFDIVFVVDATSPNDLGSAYRQDPGMYAELPVINISNSSENTHFGRVNIVDPNVASVSEIVYQLMQVLRLSVVGDAASLLMVGIEAATDRFQNKGPQTDSIVGDLSNIVTNRIDLESVLQQASNAPLAIQAKSPVVPEPTPAQFPPPQYPPANMNNYPPMQPDAAPYPNQYMPPPGYPPAYQNATYPPQGAYPGYQNPPAPNSYQAQPPVALYNNDVPSIQHDMSQYQTYIPTSEPMSQDHVAPSLEFPTHPNIPVYEEYQPVQESGGYVDNQYDPNQYNPNQYTQPFTPNQVNVAQTVGESKLDNKENPDFFNAPKIFSGNNQSGSGEKGRG
ncbi:MAG: hypothetical protein M3P33_01755 [bacterium]|nr:hypothetical protein [bacterium]